MKDITLVGSVHNDLNAYERTMKLLQKLKPQTISLELTQKKFQNILDNKSKLHDEADGFLELHQKDNFTSLKEQLRSEKIHLDTLSAVLDSYCGEMKAGIVYATETAIELICSDISTHIPNFFSKRHYKKLRKNYILLGLSFSKEDYVGRMDKLYSRADSYTAGNIFELTRLCMRDGHAASKISSEDDVVHIGGAAHMFGKYYNLYDRLKKYNPTRIKLNEADNL